MEHADALERIEIAAAEPEGLDRLMAGDTAEAAAVAGHLAGCPACTAELARIRRTAAIAREVISAHAGPGAPRPDARLRAGGRRPAGCLVRVAAGARPPRRCPSTRSRPRPSSSPSPGNAAR